MRMRGSGERMRALPKLDLESVERLEVYARALAQARTLYATAGEAPDKHAELVSRHRCSYAKRACACPGAKQTRGRCAVQSQGASGGVRQCSWQLTD